MIDFYPKDIKEIAAGGGSWGFIASQEPLARRSQIIQKNENLWAEPRNAIR